MVINMSLKSLPRCRNREDFENLLEDLSLNEPYLNFINIQIKCVFFLSIHFQINLFFDYGVFTGLQQYNIIVGPDIETFLPEVDE